MNELTARFEDSWRRFRSAVEALGPEQMDSPIRGGWTAKEMIGHLGFWLEATEGVIVGMLRGQPLRDDFVFGSGYVPDHNAPWPIADVHNAREAAWAKPRPASQVIARLDAGHENAIRLWESLDATELADDRYRNYLAGKCEEFDAHCEQLVELLTE